MSELRSRLLQALADATPPLDPASAPPQDPPAGEDLLSAWLHPWLGAHCLVRVDWKDFSTLGVQAVTGLAALRAAGVTAIDVDDLYDEDGIPLGGDDNDFDMEPAALYLAHVNRELAPHGMQLLEIGHFEDAWLLAVRNDPGAIRALNAALRPMGLAAQQY
ncbi:hypothetical protein P3W85_07780 [Cupriavidus basilensis]|uniref:Uncharacterized protein n=1 Tax=Cupriavidus basilensis TaxID=68895 RepID=A0ABT6AJR1_9BURK|nr:hypothetical protein [Cupriavidus basilensis]MDF3832844.1 hypothetical protein [Cupriavidus basilensis]